MNKRSVIITIICVALYFGAYLFLRHPVLAGPPGGRARFETYINPLTLSQAKPTAERILKAVFWPAHRFEVLIRPGYWSP